MGRIISFFFVFNLFLAGQVIAQSACPFVDAGADTTVNCRACVTLNAFVAPTYQSTSYTVTAIPYAPPFPFGFGTPILVNIDDTWSGVLNLPFTFCFFGNSYNSLIAGSNGVVSFNLGSANAYNTWPIGAAIPSGTPTDLLNSIMGPWHDIDPSVSGQMYYHISGFAPCRMIVFSWNNVAMFSSSCNSLLASHQIVLYENSNIIDVYIGNKPLCTSWNSGASIEGIQNASGSVAYVVPGRNYPIQWTATNDAWRFSPDGPPNYSVSWFDAAGSLIGTGNSVTVCPDSSSDYVAVATYALCGAASASVSDIVHVTTLIPSVNTSPDTMVCISQNIPISALGIGGTGNYTYQWNNGINLQSQLVSPSVLTSYSVIAYDDSGCASLPDTVTVGVYPPLSLAISNPAAICQGDTTGIFINGSGGNGGPYSTTWSTGATNVDSLIVAPLADMTYSVILTDNCGTPADTATALVEVNRMPVTDFSPHFSMGCQPLEVQFGDATTNSEPNSLYTWNFGDGMNASQQNPLHTYLGYGFYNVSLSVRTPEGCENSITIINAVHVLKDPVASFTYEPQAFTILFPDVWFHDNSMLAVDWKWDFGDNKGTSTVQNPYHRYDQPGTYDVQLIVTSDEGCVDTLLQKVLIDGDFTLYIPKAFTPNGDGINESFLPMGYGINSFKMDIFDRWGSLIFHSDNVNEPWYGKMQGTGTMCKRDVYVFKVIAYDYKDAKHEFVGRVSLVY